MRTSNHGRVTQALLALAALAGLISGCGGSTAPATDATSAPDTSATASGPQVFADCITGSVEPKSLTVACGDGNFVVADITWDSWGQDEAGGGGTAQVNSCDPNCADGSVGNYISGVTLSKIDDCDGTPTYTAIEVDFMDEGPQGFDDPYKTTLGCGEEAAAPTEEKGGQTGSGGASMNAGGTDVSMLGGNKFEPEG